MIKTITSCSPNIVAIGQSSLPYINMSVPSAGMMRYNGNSQSIEVYDGSNWIQLGMESSTIGTSLALDETVVWAQTKMAEEKRIKELCEKFPALQKAKDNFDIVYKLVNEQL